MHRHRPAVSPAIGDNAKGAAMIAAILYLHKCARMGIEAGCQMRRGGAHRHDVAHDHLVERLPSGRIKLFRIADYTGDLGHRRKALWIDLRRTAGDNDIDPRPCSRRPPDGGACFADGVVRHRAAVDDHDIALSVDRADRLALRQVQAAAKADDFGGRGTKGGRHRRRSRHAVERSPPCGPAQPAWRVASESALGADLVIDGRSRRFSASNVRALPTLNGRP